VLGKLWKFGRPKRDVDISIVICSIDDERFRQVTASYAERMGDARYEIIRIPDARSLCEGYNRGLDQSSGDVVIFSHDDIEILTPDFRERLTGHLRLFDVVGIAGTTRLLDGRWNSAGQPWVHGQCVQPALGDGEGYNVEIYGQAEHLAQPNIHALDGVFLATRRAAAKEVRFDAKTFDGFHLYDIDFTFRAFRAGLRLGVCNDILLYHASRGGYRDPAWRTYFERFQRKFARKLDPGPPGVATLHAREPVRTKEEALTLFRYYLKQCGLAEAA
jgi:GT2 family glycosyltransferase